MDDKFQQIVKSVYKAESSRVLAGLVRILGDLDLAEEALQEAFSIALKQWPEEGIPQNPYSWLISTGKFRAIDALRRAKRGNEIVQEKFADVDLVDDSSSDKNHWDKLLIEDDQLRLIFYCCHPALPLESRIALALREVCGLTTNEIARAYLTTTETMKKRLTRAKAQIKEQQIPFELPAQAELDNRIQSALQVVYLIFNEGYSASAGEDHIRGELTGQAIALARELVRLLATPESLGLLALMLLQESRKDARVDAEGDIIPLEEQDRRLWDQTLIAEGVQLIQQVVMFGRLGQYTLQAAIASVHAQADSVENTQWDLIISYYDMLLSLHGSPVVALNRAIAVGMHEGPEAGLALVDEVMATGKLNAYPVAYAARAEFLKKMGDTQGAVAAYQDAISRVRQAPERRYLERQLEKIK